MTNAGQVELKPDNIAGCTISIRSWSLARQLNAMVDTEKLSRLHLIALAVQIGDNQHLQGISVNTLSEMQRLSEELADKITSLKRKLINVG